jgi:hypothetical protein
LFKIDELSWTFPILSDICTLNAERRKLVYIKRRDFAMKLAKETSQDLMQVERFSRKGDQTARNHTLNFDLTRNFYNEEEPQKVLSCLRYSRANAKQDHEYLPHFADFNRNQMVSSLKLTHEPIMLRSIVGNRS